ncbi:MAG: flavoprotein, partial [Actinomycetales bacterium]|nr:flavoprotein [Actinomycetales bacterium]
PTAVFAASADFGADTEGQADEQPLTARVRRATAELATMLRAGLGEAESSSDAAADRTDATAQEAAPAPAAGSTLDAEFSDFVPMGTLLGRD